MAEPGAYPTIRWAAPLGQLPHPRPRRAHGNADPPPPHSSRPVMGTLPVAAAVFMAVPAAALSGAALGALARVGPPGRTRFVEWLAHGFLFGVLAGAGAAVMLLR